MGTVAEDITTAFAGGEYVDGVWTGGERDDRASQSTLGNFIADVLLDQAQSRIDTADLAITNPGGLRAELLVGEDGVVTYEEANAVLPFGNNVAVKTFTGEQLLTVLNQQWQRDADGEIPSRPYLQLGVSDNVFYTFDDNLPEGERITGLWIDGEPVDPVAEYELASFDFLMAGGDNFVELAQGTNQRDTGLGDRDALAAYLGENADVRPDFASRSARVVGAPTEILSAGDTVDLQVSGIDLTSLGSPQNSTVSVEWLDTAAQATSAETTAFYTAAAAQQFAVTDGVADISVQVPADAPQDARLVITAAPSDTVVSLPVSTDVVPTAPGTDPGAEPGTEPGAEPGTDIPVVDGPEGGDLAVTGSEPAWPLAALALLMLAAGGAVFVRRRSDA